MPRKKHKDPKVTYLVNFGRGDEAQKIFDYLKEKARLSRLSLSGLLIESGFHRCPKIPTALDPRRYPATPFVPPSPPAPPPYLSNEPSDLDYTEFTDPLPHQTSVSDLPNSKPENTL